MSKLKYKLEIGQRFYCPKCGANKGRIKPTGLDRFECRCCLTEISLERSENGKTAIVRGKEIENERA